MSWVPRWSITLSVASPAALCSTSTVLTLTFGGPIGSTLAMAAAASATRSSEESEFRYLVRLLIRSQSALKSGSRVTCLRNFTRWRFLALVIRLANTNLEIVSVICPRMGSNPSGTSSSKASSAGLNFGRTEPAGSR